MENSQILYSGFSSSNCAIKLQFRITIFIHVIGCFIHFALIKLIANLLFEKFRKSEKIEKFEIPLSPYCELFCSSLYSFFFLSVSKNPLIIGWHSFHLFNSSLKFFSSLFFDSFHLCNSFTHLFNSSFLHVNSFLFMSIQYLYQNNIRVNLIAIKKVVK